MWPAQSSTASRPFNGARQSAGDNRRFSFEDFAILDAIQTAGFHAVEAWQAHAHPDVLKHPEAIAYVREAPARRRLTVVGYACGLGEAERQPDLTERYLATAQALGAPLVVGGFGTGAAPLLAKWARAYGVKVALQNHPEQTPEKVLAKICPFPDVLGAAVDGWFATQGSSPAEAIRRLAPDLLHVQLNDVRTLGARDTCVLGERIAGIPQVVQTLRDIGMGRSSQHRARTAGSRPHATCRSPSPIPGLLWPAPLNRRPGERRARRCPTGPALTVSSARQSRRLGPKACLLPNTHRGPLTRPEAVVSQIAGEKNPSRP